MKIDRLTRNPVDPGQVSEAAEAALDRLDDALMKRGTLGADSIDWAQTRRDAQAVLGDCLHLQALRGLVFALCQSQSDSDLLAALSATQGALAPSVWSVLHPQGGRAERKRQQWAADMLAALAQALKQADLANRGLPPETLATARAITPLAEAAGLEVAAWLAGLTEARPRGQTGPGKALSEPEPRGGALTRDLDARGRAELRRDLRALAERISRHDPAADVAFLMRRYAAWLEFSALPPVDAEGRVEQQPMPANIVDEFRAAAERPTETALARLEDRLFNSPDWFEGHRLAARMAQGLGHQAIAEAIRARVAQRLTALPGLADLRYANGAPYLEPGLADWAQGGSTVASSLMSASPMSASLAQAAPEAEPETDSPADLQGRIAALEGAMSAGASRRARAVAKLALARALAAAGLPGHARLLLQELSDTLADPVLAEWDRDLAEELRAELSRLPRL